MGSKVEVWKLVEPVIPCGSGRKLSSRKLEKGVDIHKLQEEIAAVGARVNSIDEQIDIIKAALPELDNKIRYASLGMPTSSFPLDELQNLKAIHFKLLHFWEDMSRKQLEKLQCLSDYLQILETQKGGNKDTLPDGIDSYKEIGQHVNEKIKSDIRKKQELEVKLYFDRISCVPKSSKATPTHYSPPKRGPQQIGRERTGQGGAPTPPISGLQRISIPSTLDLHRVSGPSTPARQWIPIPSPEHEEGTTIPSTPAQERISAPSTPAQERIAAPSTPAQERISAPSTPAKEHSSTPSLLAHQWNASGQKCKESATTPSTPALRSPTICNSIKV